jgi:hypothetical protein
MSIKCLQQDALPKLAPAAKGLPSEPFITLTELVSFVVWGAPLTSGKSGSLRQCIHEEEAAHRRGPRKERGTAAVSQATARFYGLLSQAVARSHAALWGLKQVGEQPSAVEHEQIQPSYLITPRHHDLLDNELHEEISPDEQEMLDRLFDHAARERAARLVRYLDIKISADDAALLVSQYHADRRQPVADSPPANSKVSRSRKWRPLHVSIAWSLTRDEQFCTDIAENASAAQRIFCASLQLEHEMIEAGCFNVVNEIMRLDPPTRTVEIQTHRLVPGYTGRFRALAEDYELRGRRDYTDSIAQIPHAPDSACNRVSLGDYLLGRWVESFREIMAHVSDEAISARGVAVDGNVRKPAGEMPAACVTDAMWIDLDGVVWEGPQPVDGSADHPRRWVDVTLMWEQCLVAFPAMELEQVSTPVRGRIPSVSNTSPAPATKHGTVKQRGRKTGSGQYSVADRPLIDEMEELRKWKTGRPTSRYAAAQILSPRAPGSKNGDSKARRLAGKHEKQYPGEW